MRSGPRRAPTLASAALLGILAAGSPVLVPGAAATQAPRPQGPDKVGAPDDEQLARSITTYSLEGSTTSLADTQAEDDGDEQVLALASDILFAFDSADLPPGADDVLGDLVGQVPQGAAVAVLGHTDSLGEEQYNLELSQRRAEAVADALRGQRPDLQLSVEGRGESEPVVEEGGDDAAEDRAQNRRVELRYAG